MVEKMWNMSCTKLLLPLILLVTLCGCGDGRPQLAPVTGQVLLDGKPLTFGGVMFQPDKGQPATGVIGADGKFQLSTFDPGDGAAVGRNRVRVTCYEGQKAAAENPDAEMALGRLLIPTKYTSIDTSGIVVEVDSSGKEVTIELSSRG